MLKIGRTKKAFSPLQNATLRQAGMLERADLRACIMHEIDDRIDVLAIARDGAAVVVQLQRGDNELQMLQVISYAGMAARWTIAEFEAQLSTEQWQQPSDFLDVDITEQDGERPQATSIAFPWRRAGKA